MGFKIIVEGDYACFTRPEMKVERVSYDVPTPGALEGLLKSIYWKPAIRYCIDKIVVFNPIKFTNIQRNEVKDKTSYRRVFSQMKGRNEDLHIYANECRSQRNSMVLKGVKYGIEFHFELTGIRSEREVNLDANAKHAEIIRKNLINGKYFKVPHLGCKEFTVTRIEMVDDFDTSEIQNYGDIDLGFMLYHVNFKDGGQPIGGDWDNRIFSDDADPIFYRPHMIDGIIDVRKYREEQIC